jgi:hypothetical protein
MSQQDIVISTKPSACLPSSLTPAVAVIRPTVVFPEPMMSCLQIDPPVSIVSRNEIQIQIQIQIQIDTQVAFKVVIRGLTVVLPEPMMSCLQMDPPVSIVSRNSRIISS